MCHRAGGRSSDRRVLVCLQHVAVSTTLGHTPPRTASLAMRRYMGEGAGRSFEPGAAGPALGGAAGEPCSAAGEHRLFVGPSPPVLAAVAAVVVAAAAVASEPAAPPVGSTRSGEALMTCQKPDATSCRSWPADQPLIPVQRRVTSSVRPWTGFHAATIDRTLSHATSCTYCGDPA